MTYQEAHDAMTICLSFGCLTSDHAKHWIAIEDALLALPFADFAQIALAASACDTLEDCAIVCIVD